MQSIPVKKLPHFKELELPCYESKGAAGMDLRAANELPITIEPGERKLIPTGLAIAIPQGFVGQVCSRSGLSIRDGIMAAPGGLVDSDYRGEMHVILCNFNKRVPFVVNRGDRIAQLMITPVFQPTWHEVDELAPTERGMGGFGSTGAS